jgi:hypothetical protein
VFPASPLIAVAAIYHLFALNQNFLSFGCSAHSADESIPPLDPGDEAPIHDPAMGTAAV